MSKKKSYMDIANILKEDIISAFFRGLFTGKRTSKKDVDSQLKKIENKFRKDIKKDVDNINRTTANIHRIINALLLIPVELSDLPPSCVPYICL